MAGRRLGVLVSSTVNRVFAQSDAMGALPILYAATQPAVRGGDYVGPSGPFQQHGHPKLVPMVRSADDREAARRLWEVSERLTGVRYLALGPA